MAAGLAEIERAEEAQGESVADQHAGTPGRISEEAQFRLLVQSVTDYAIYMLDRDGHVSSWNLGAQRIKGYLPEEIIGRHFSTFYTEEDRANGEPARALETAAREGRFEKEGWRVRKDGSRFRASIVLDAIRANDGLVIGFAKITRDITERARAQEELEAAREALFQSQKLEAIGQLTGGIAHDFNNLLMAVQGSLELLRKRLPNEPRSLQLLENALQATQRGTSLTQRMLAFARRQTLASAPVDIPGLVLGMSGLLQRSLGPTISIESRFPASLPAVMVDANQLELALLNLAVNARDAMPAGGPLVISAAAAMVGPDHVTRLPAGDYICISVADAGEGMDAETLSHAIEPFFTTKGVGKGTGLGLSMVQGTAEQMGGRLLLHSQKGQGTVAEIWLPVAAASEPVQKPPVEASMPISRLSVLAVDDDPLVLMNTAAMLEDLGHQVFEAASARRALEILAGGEKIDLIVTDQAMPQMTGLQLIETIRHDFPDMPAILATGYAELPPGMAIRLVKLDKPFFEIDLARSITAAFVD